MEKWLESVYSDGSKDFVSNPLPKKGEKIKVSIRLFEDAPVKYVILRPILNGVDLQIEMKPDYVYNGLSYYSAYITCYEDVIKYNFIIATDNNIYYYNQYGITDYITNEVYDFKILVNYNQPKWVRESVFYQIFPERFCNGDDSLSVKDNEYSFDGHPAIRVKDWNAIPKEYNEAHCLDFYGGDLIGVKNKIPYLKELGITAIYMNPIFYGATVHKYDCLDYFEIDPHFGGNKAFEELMKELHKNNMKLILDTSINHTGTANKWFNKEGIFFDKSIGAYNNKDSKERKYYYFNDEDNSYKGWMDVDTLPTLNYTSDELKDILYRNSKSLVKKWLKPPYNIDGWRFDVADTMARNNEIQLSHEVWPEIRKSIKEENENAYILAEHWGDCSEYLQGNEWDSSMNYYGFGRPVREFLGETDPCIGRNAKLKSIKSNLNAHKLGERIKQHLCKLPFVIQENQFNLFDSHDISRLHNNKNISYDEYRGAVIMLFTMIGAPNMYYGDEAGINGRITSMEGCRYPMCWDKDIKSTKHYKLYSKLAHIKTSKEALKYGGFKIVWDKDNVFAFARITKEQVIITIFSTDNNDRVIKICPKIFGKDIKSEYKDMLDNNFEIHKEGCEILINVKAHNSYLIEL